MLSGGSLGSAVLAEILTSHAGRHGIPAEDAFTTGFWICAAVAAAGALAALALPRHLTARPHGKSSDRGCSRVFDRVRAPRTVIDVHEN